MDNNKRNISGAKTVDKKLKGKISNIIKGVTAITVTVGLAITARQAIEMYNHWQNNRNLDNLESIMTKTQYDEDLGIEDDSKLEEFETIMEEYKQALQNNDDKRKEELDKKVEEEGYFKLIYQEFENTIVKKLGYDPEKVQIVMGRDGYFLADKAKLAEGVYIEDYGTISNRVKIRDEKGESIPIPTEDIKELDEAGKIMDISKCGVMGTAELYEKLISLRTPEAELVIEDEGEER